MTKHWFDAVCGWLPMFGALLGAFIGALLGILGEVWQHWGPR